MNSAVVDDDDDNDLPSDSISYCARGKSSQSEVFEYKDQELSWLTNTPRHRSRHRFSCVCLINISGQSLFLFSLFQSIDLVQKNLHRCLRCLPLVCLRFGSSRMSDVIRTPKSSLSHYLQLSSAVTLQSSSVVLNKL